MERISVCISIMIDLLLLLTPVIFLIFTIKPKFDIRLFFIKFIIFIFVIYVITFALFIYACIVLKDDFIERFRIMLLFVCEFLSGCAFLFIKIKRKT